MVQVFLVIIVNIYHDDHLKYRPNSFVLDMTLALGANSLRQGLKVTNTNPSAAEFSFTTALHTYFAVGDARKTYLQGANGLTYLTANEAKSGTFVEDRDQATMAEMTDRIYYDAPGTRTNVYTQVCSSVLHALLACVCICLLVA
jgi:D-hexose-6-phosphate mutarotase